MTGFAAAKNREDSLTGVDGDSGSGRTRDNASGVNIGDREMRGAGKNKSRGGEDVGVSFIIKNPAPINDSLEIASGGM